MEELSRWSGSILRTRRKVLTIDVSCILVGKLHNVLTSRQVMLKLMTKEFFFDKEFKRDALGIS